MQGQQNQLAAKVRVRVTRAFFLKADEIAEKGDVVEVPGIFARELVAGNKAEAVDSSTPIGKARKPAPAQQQGQQK